MTDKLKIIPLGGLGEIGKNLTVIEHGEDILVIDCGMGFPDGDMLGIDIVIPNFSYLIENRNRVRAIVITHGHEDHIGAVSFLLREVAAPVYATALTAGLIKLKLEEAGTLNSSDVRVVAHGDVVRAGRFSVEFIRVNHSIAGAAALAVSTPHGVVIHTGDFKIDTTPVDGETIDLARFGEYGKSGVLALLMDSTNAERPGYAMSERKVGEALEPLFREWKNRIIVTTFASNVHRIQQIFDVAHNNGRKVAITGRSMENILRVSKELGYLNIPDGVLVDLQQVKSYPAGKVCIITTGSQGESMSALYRMAFSSHRQIELQPGDRVIISATPVPGNEKDVFKMINELLRRGTDVVYDKLAPVHVSGHACQEEMKLIMALTKPKFFIPVHGETKHLKAAASLARQCGIPESNTKITEVGSVIELTPQGIKVNGSVPAGRVLVDGLGVGDVGSVVLRDRKHLASDGLIVVTFALDASDNLVVSGPDIVTRGFVYVKESDELMENMRKYASGAVEELFAKGVSDWPQLKSAVRSALGDYLYKTTKRNPMILPVFMQV